MECFRPAPRGGEISRRRVLACLTSLIGLLMSQAFAADPLHTLKNVPATPAIALLDGHASCTFGDPGSPFTLQEAVERALCNNSSTRSAWVAVKERAAALGVAKATYLPAISANGEWVHDNVVTHVRSHPELSSNYATGVHSGALSLSWLLYDFGGRRAELDSAKALLSAAEASEEAVLQQAFADTAKAYYAAQAAREQSRADEAIVADAESSLTAAQEKVQRGVAPNLDGYQAQTAYEQAVLTQNHNQARALTAQGNLATMLALSPDASLNLEALDDEATPTQEFEQSVSALMTQAERAHPAVIAAEKELQAARAGIKHAESQGRPSIKLVGQYSQNDQPLQQGLGLPHYPATGRDGYIGIQVSIPLFSGYATTYQVHQAQAQAEQQAVALDKTRQQVALQVWSAYQTLKLDTQNLAVSAKLQGVAEQAWRSSRRRYHSGVGTILELLSTQAALAQARQQRVEALITWRYDRLALAAALGVLGRADAQVR